MPWSLTLVNESGFSLTPYPLVGDSPRAPRRADEPRALESRPLEHGATRAVGAGGPDVAWLAPDASDAAAPNGFTLRLALSDAAPRIVVVTYRYRVPPGEEGGDAELAPVPFAEYPFERVAADERVAAGEHVLTIGAGMRQVALERRPSPAGRGCALAPLLALLALLRVG